MGGTLGFLHMIPFKDKAGNYHATPIIGYRGVVQVLTEAGQITHVEARVVYKEDIFVFEYVNDVLGGVKFRHVPEIVLDPGPMLGVYARFWKGANCIHTEVMRKSEVDKVRNSSRAKNSGPWVDWYEEMAKKTVLKRGAKYIPILPLQAEALAKADEAEFGDGPVEADYEIEETSTTQEVKNQLQEALKPKGKGSEPASPLIDEAAGHATVEDAETSEPSEPEPESETPDEEGLFPSDKVEPEPAQEPEPESKPEPERQRKPGGGRKPEKWHLERLRDEMEALLEAHPGDVSGILKDFKSGFKLPENWDWRENANRKQLEQIIEATKEDLNLAKETA